MKKLIVSICLLLGIVSCFSQQNISGKAEQKISHAGFNVTLFEGKDYGVIDNKIFFISKKLTGDQKINFLTVIDYAHAQDTDTTRSKKKHGRYRILETRDNREIVIVEEVGNYFVGKVKNSYVTPAFYFKSGYSYFPIMCIGKINENDLVANIFDGELFLIAKETPNLGLTRSAYDLMTIDYTQLALDEAQKEMRRQLYKEPTWYEKVIKLIFG